MLDREKDGIYTTEIRGRLVGALTRPQVIAAVGCTECSAPQGQACTGHDMTGDKSHRPRRQAAMREYGIIPPQAMLAGADIDRWYKKFRAAVAPPVIEKPSRPRKKRRRKANLSDVTVRYVCPLCSGDHPRGQHLRAVVERRRQERAAA
jgi:hypothetical protein